MSEQEGIVVWFTGLPGSGKTTLAKALEVKLKERGLKVEHLDGDIVRESLCKDLGFTREDRDTNIDRVMFVASALSRNGVAVLCSFVSPYRDKRHSIKYSGCEFVECHVECPLAVCIERDPKGMYARAIAGEIDNFTGVDGPYEPPMSPDIKVRTSVQTVGESAEVVLQWMIIWGYA